MPPPEKPELRARLRKQRRLLPPDVARKAGVSVAARARDLPGWAEASHLGIYAATDGELDPTELCRLARAEHKLLYLPVIRDDRHLGFAEWRQDSELVDNRFGIPEPAPSARQCPVQTLDILFLPLVAWDRSGARLGMGGGYYDRTLEGVSGPLLVGLAHSAQEIESLPLEPWDVILDWVITERETHRPDRTG